MSLTEKALRDRQPGSRAGRQSLIEKLRQLVRHPATDEAIRSIAKDKLAKLSPRSPQKAPGSPSRRATDRSLQKEAIQEELIRAAWDGLDRNAPADARHSAEEADRRYRAARQESHILNILA